MSARTAPTATVEQATGDGLEGFRVSVTWSGGVDRPNVGGYILSNRKTAERLATAINAGVVYMNPEVRTDCNGATYVHATSRVLGRTASADLKRLGY